MTLCCSLWSTWSQTWLHIKKGSVFRSFSKPCLLRYQDFPSGDSERLPTAWSQNRSTELSAQHSTKTHRSPLPFECILICVWFLSAVSFIDLLKVIPWHDMNVIQCKQIILNDMVHQQSHGKSCWGWGGCHITVDTSVPKSQFHWKIPIYYYKYCQVLMCQSYFCH